MKISSIVDITGGKLLNSPSISFVTQTHTNIKKINDGDLFISSNIDEIKEAIKNGAFGIIFDFDMDILSLDQDIAYIKVDSIKQASTKLLRFKLATFNLTSYCVDFIAYEFLEVLINKTNKEAYFINESLSSIEILQNLENDKILISQNEQFLYDIYPKTKKLSIKHMSFENLIVHSIFETSFLYKDEYFYKLRIPYIYLNHLLFIKETFKIEEIENQKLKNLSFMQPIFLNKQNQIVEYGKSNRFIISSKYKDISDVEFKFINTIFKYGKSLKIDASNMDNKEILKNITNNKFNCLYFTNQTNDNIIEALKLNEINEHTLF